ncbi:GreA/GreB family elongation factor [Nocardia sp. NPDC004711]
MNLLPKTKIVLVGSGLILTKVNEDGTTSRHFDGTMAMQFRYTIVPDSEADAISDRYSESLPASQALLGHLVGDIVETTIDNMPIRVRVQSID